MLNTKFLYPIHEVKVGQWLNYKVLICVAKGGGHRGNRRFPYYKMVPNMGIELNGLWTFFLTPIPIGFLIWSSHVPKKGGDC